MGLKIKAIARDSWSLSWPMTLIMFFIFLIGSSDVYIAGRFGKEVQASYGIAFQIYFLLTIVGSALGVGSVSVVSRLFTSGRKDDLSLAVHSAIITAMFSGAALGIAGMLFSKNIIHNFNIPEVLKDFSTSFTCIYSAGLLFNYFLLNTNGVLRACGMVRKSLFTMGLVCILNIAFNFIFAFHTPLGFRGIAVATLVSTFFGSIVNLAYIRKLTGGVFRFSFSAIKEIINIGWPAGLLQILWQLGSMVIFLILSALPRHNIEILAAFTNGLKIESAIFLPAFAFNLACAVIVGNLLGKRENRDAFLGGIITAITGVIIVSVLTLIIMLNARAIASFFSNNETVVKESARYLYISLLFEPFMAWGVILAGGLNGAGDTRSVMSIVAFSVWLVRIPLSYLLGIYFGLCAASIWWSMNLSILIQTIFITRRYFAQKWMAYHIDSLSAIE